MRALFYDKNRASPGYAAALKTLLEPLGVYSVFDLIRRANEYVSSTRLQKETS